MQNYIKIMFLFLLFVSCEKSVETRFSKDEKSKMILSTKSQDPKESTFDRERIPDYTFRAYELLTPIISSSDRFFYAEIKFKEDEYPFEIIPEIHGYYPSSQIKETEYLKNHVCIYDRTLGIHIGYVRDNILALKFTYIPPELPAGELILHTAVKCGNNVYDRYIMITDFSGSLYYQILNAGENITDDGILEFVPGGKADPDKITYKPGFSPVYCDGRDN
ncbi:hypothetical protein [Parabacteroides goldsteinii]|uniref:hypothetical protein n=1 Tax=Parabacteroides goldsteinii TaxID=328812 RepID=UPI0039945087